MQHRKTHETSTVCRKNDLHTISEIYYTTSGKCDDCHNRYTKEQKLDIGRRIYDGELTRYKAAEEYEISDETARD